MHVILKGSESHVTEEWHVSQLTGSSNLSHYASQHFLRSVLSISSTPLAYALFLNCHSKTPDSSDLPLPPCRLSDSNERFQIGKAMWTLEKQILPFYSYIFEQRILKSKGRKSKFRQLLHFIIFWHSSSLYCTTILESMFASTVAKAMNAICRCVLAKTDFVCFIRQMTWAHISKKCLHVSFSFQNSIFKW